MTILWGMMLLMLFFIVVGIGGALLSREETRRIRSHYDGLNVGDFVTFQRRYLNVPADYRGMIVAKEGDYYPDKGFLIVNAFGIGEVLIDWYESEVVDKTNEKPELIRIP